MENRIKIGISTCLLGENVRWNGGHSRDRYLTDILGQYVEYVPVCPEVECGMGVPRETLRLVGDPDNPNLVTSKTNIDHTHGMNEWARKRVEELEKENLCGFVFKKNSPSSGLFRVPVKNFKGMLRKEDIHPQKTICTYKMARFLDKDGIISQYSLQYLRYYLSLNIDASPHDALGDILVLEALFERIHAKANDEFGTEAVDKMIEVTQNPVLLARMPFGKHKGMKFEEIPTDYLQWLSGTDLDEDIAYTVKHHLGI